MPLDWSEAAAKFPAVMSLVSDLVDGVEQAKLDGKISGEEMGNLLAIAGPRLGRLIDEIIADAAD